MHAEGDPDVRGTLAVDPDAPMGLRAIRLRFDVVTDPSGEELDALLRLAWRDCVVHQTLAGGPLLDATRERG